MWSLEPKETKLIISRDVIFNEQLLPYLEKTNIAGEIRTILVEHSIKDDLVQVEQGRQEGLDQVEPIDEC